MRRPHLFGLPGVELTMLDGMGGVAAPVPGLPLRRREPRQRITQGLARESGPRRLQAPRRAVHTCDQVRFPPWSRSRYLGVQGNLNASSSPGYPAPLIATTMNCLPFSMYVMGEPLCGAGR